MAARVLDSGRIGLAKYFIGQWGGNPSTTTYGQALTSYQVGGQWWQYAAWYGTNNLVRVARKDPSGTWETVVLSDMALHYNDEHNVLAFGISASDGRLHLVAGQHGNPMQYTASAPNMLDDTPPWTANLFSPSTATLGGTVVGNDLTLPTFTSKPDGGLLFWIRRGTSGNGRLHLCEYEAGTWTVLGDVTSATGNWTAPNGAVSPNRNLYWAPPLYGHGNLHLIGTWREANQAVLVPSTAPMANHHIVYCYSEDDGRTWRNNAGTTVATTGSNPISVGDPGISTGQPTYDCRNSIQCYDMCVGPNGLIGYLPDYVDGALLTAANGASYPGYVATLAERDKWASEHPRWRVPPASGWAGGTWPAVSIKIGGTHLFSSWPPGRHTCTRGKMVFTPAGDMVVVHSGLLVCSARAAENYADWTLDVPSGAGFGDLMIDRSRQDEGIVSVLTIEQAPPGATASAVLVRDIALDA